MEESTIRIQLDFKGNPFIVEACDTDGTETKQSTKEFLSEEITNVGLSETLYGTEFVNGVYRVRVSGSWDYFRMEYDYEILYKIVT